MAALNAGGPLVAARGPADWPGATVEAQAQAPGVDLRGWLIALAVLLLALDALGSAWLARGRGPGKAVA